MVSTFIGQERDLKYRMLENHLRGIQLYSPSERDDRLSELDLRKKQCNHSDAKFRLKNALAAVEGRSIHRDFMDAHFDAPELQDIKTGIKKKKSRTDFRDMGRDMDHVMNDKRKVKTVRIERKTQNLVY